MSNELYRRIISGLLLAPAILGIVWSGGLAYDILVAVGAVIMAFEWQGITTTPRTGPFGKKEAQRWYVTGIVYVSLFLVSLLFLRHSEGAWVVIWLLAIVWATDIGAFFAGRFFQGPKIWPAVSPKKTWSGLCGGMLSAAIVGAIFTFFVGTMGPLAMGVIAMVLAVIAQAGDFFESWVKRKFGVKDSGTLIPGHGGLLDRVDGLAAVAPVLMFILLCKGSFF